MTHEGYNSDEETNAFIASLPSDEQAEAIAERDFEKYGRCDMLGGMFVSFDSRMTPEQQVEAAQYLEWLKMRDNAGKVVDDKEG
ncbi:MAG TPA: hypothetical protein V6C72_18435 [Chroococcales cyanobacterium]